MFATSLKQQPKNKKKTFIIRMNLYVDRINGNIQNTLQGSKHSGRSIELYELIEYKIKLMLKVNHIK